MDVYHSIIINHNTFVIMSLPLAISANSRLRSIYLSSCSKTATL